MTRSDWLFKIWCASFFVYNIEESFRCAWRFHDIFLTTQDTTMLTFEICLFIVFIASALFQWTMFIRIGKPNYELQLTLARIENQQKDMEVARLGRIINEIHSHVLKENKNIVETKLIKERSFEPEDKNRLTKVE